MTADEFVYIRLDEWVVLAARVLGIDPGAIRKIAHLDLADSALHAPAAGFGETDFYPTLAEKTAVLGWHLAMNHALPDGNKRTAFTTMVVFVRRNGSGWRRPEENDAVDTMLAVAAGSITIEELTNWVAAHIVVS